MIVVVFSRRPRGDTIAIWIRSGTARDIVFQVGARALLAMELATAHVQMDFSLHSSSGNGGGGRATHTTTTASPMLSLDNLRHAVRRGTVKLMVA